MANVTGIIQVRMSSNRLPGKVLKDLCGKPVLWHAVTRLRRTETLTGLVIATSVDPSDDPIEAYALELGVPCVRGPLDNVLERFRLVLERFPTDVVVRVTGDCPLVDPHFVDLCVRTLIDNDGDYIDALEPETCIHEGCDPISARIFRRMLDEAADDPVAREHTTGYLKIHPDFGRRVLVTIPEESKVSQPVRISVDTPADLAFLTALYAETGAEPGAIDIDEVVRLVETRPDLRAINAHVRQRAADKRAKNALLICQASQTIGFGHLSRVLAVGDALREACSYGVSLVVDGDAAALARARESDIRTLTPPKGLVDGWVADLIRAEMPAVVVVDVLDSPGPDTLRTWKALGPVTVLLDDGSDRRLTADAVFYPPLASGQLPPTPADISVFSGWEWAIAAVAAGKTPVSDRSRLLVVMGGSDPRGWTIPVCNALAGKLESANIDVVIGPGVADGGRVASEVSALLPEAAVHCAPSSLAPLMACAAVMLSAFGVSAFEAVGARVPACLICADDDQLASASVLVEAGVAIAAQSRTAFDADDIVTSAVALMNDPARRQAMSEAAMGLADGAAARRIAAWIADAVEARG